MPEENTLMRRKTRYEDNIKLDIKFENNGLNFCG
jgi:hypothetical protein